MTLGSDLSAALPGLQAAAESRMTDFCRVLASGGVEVWNDASESYTTADAVFSYEGPCLVKFGATQPREVDGAGQTVIEQQVTVHLPVLTSTGVQPGHVVEVTASATDPALVGRLFRVAGQFHQTYATARRFPVEEVS